MPRGRPKKKKTPEDLIDVQLQRKDIEHIVNQLYLYGMPYYHRVCDDVIEKENIRISKILNRKIVEYPKSTLISPSISELDDKK